jgi:hypothetical protein
MKPTTRSDLKEELQEHCPVTHQAERASAVECSEDPRACIAVSAKVVPQI